MDTLEPRLLCTTPGALYLQALVEQYRHAHHLPLLRHSTSLANFAQRFAGTLATNGDWVTDPGHAYHGMSLTARASAAHIHFFVLGETLAWTQGYPDPIAETLHLWDASPAHHALLVDLAFRTLGTGVASGPGPDNTPRTVCVLELAD